ncbi:MAG: hypothetical protein PHP74_01085 [Candidatus Gracilibacteria bacterium]|nr:hypothetical protein [Candidatus Gracilibacteria bacterium]
MDNKRSEDAGMVDVAGFGFDAEVGVSREVEEGADNGGDSFFAKGNIRLVGDSFVVKGITEECMKEIKAAGENFLVDAYNLSADAKKALVDADFFEVSVFGVTHGDRKFHSQRAIANPKISSAEATASDINERVLMIVKEACELALAWTNDSSESGRNSFAQVAVKPIYPA